MEVGLYFEEYAEGWTFQTEGIEVTNDMISEYVQLCRFLTPTYTNPAYAAKNYSGRMAPGLLVLSLAEGLVLSAGVTRQRGIFLMELQPKFLKPVRAGDTITNTATFASKKLTSKTDRGVVITDHDVRNQNGETVIFYKATRMIRTREFVEAS